MDLVTPSARGPLVVSSARVVGTGSIGSRYLRTLAGISDTLPIAVPVSGALRDPGITEYALVESIGDLDRPHVELCVIASATNRHLTDAILFSDSADVLLIEKPLSFSTQSLTKVTSWKSMSKIAVASPLRFTEGFLTVVEALRTVGEITGVNVQCRSWLPDWRPDSDFRLSYSADAIQGGVLLDLVHEIDYCLQLFGDPVKLSAALGRQSVLAIESESSANLLWRYGTYDLQMTLDYVSRPPTRSLTVYGTTATLAWDLLGASVTVWDHEHGSREITKFPDDLDRDLILRRQIRSVVACTSDPRVSTLTQAWRAVALCELAKESAVRAGTELDASTALEVSGAG